MSKIKRIAGFFKGSYLNLIPSTYRQDASELTTLYKWLLIGLLIRLAFMPFTVYYPDLLALYWRSSWITYQGRVHTIGGGDLIIHFFHAFFLWIFKPLMPYFDTILNDPKMGPAATWRMFQTFGMHPYVFRTLFLFKVPYLIFDLGCAFLFLHLFKDRKKGSAAFKFWMVNPIVIFATYIAARYESVVIFFVLLSLYFAKNNQWRKSALCLGGGIIIKFYPLFFLPLFIILRGKKWLKSLEFAFLAFIPYAFLLLLAHSFQRAGEVPGVVRIYNVDHLLRMNFSLIGLDVIFVFVAAYMVILLSLATYSEYSYEKLWKSMFVVMLLLFATCHFHVHYFMWLIPLLTLQVAEDKRFTRLFIVQVLCFVVYSWQWNRHFFGYLFTPLNFPYFAWGVPNPLDIVARFYSYTRTLGIARSIFSAVCIWMIYLVVRDAFTKKAKLGES